VIAELRSLWSGLMGERLSHKKQDPQGLKPKIFSPVTARLKSCPDTKPSFIPRGLATPMRDFAETRIRGCFSQLRCRKSGYAAVGMTILGVIKKTADPSASLGACDFFNFPCSLWLESCEEHLPTSIAGVLRLRAIDPPLCDRSARRFAQDDGFVEGLKNM
jgi:hypothetical protein